MFVDLRSRKKLNRIAVWAGFFFGMGVFQLFDGIVDHKLLRIHQIRYVDNVVLYDLIWNAAGLLLLLAGFIIYLRARRASLQTGT